MPAQSPSVLTFEDARHVVEEHASQLRQHGKEQNELLESAGQVLTEPVNTFRNFAPFIRSTRVCYAMRAEGVAQVPAELEVVGEVKAGGSLDPGFQLQARQVVSIMTRTAAPDGADTVVMVEYTSMQGTRVTVNRSVSAGENIVPTGAEAKRGAR